MRRTMGLFVFLALPAVSRTPPDSLLLRPPPHSQWGYAVMDVKTGELLAEGGGRRFLSPASTVKLLTTAFVLEEMPAERRFPTRLYRSGPVENGCLRGDLWIRGGGNPALGSERWDSAQRPEAVFGLFARALRQAGIREVRGRVQGDASVLVPQIQNPKMLWEDAGNYYGAAPSGLCFHDNFYTLGIGVRDGKLFPRSVRPARSGVSRFQITARNQGRNGDSCVLFGAFRNTPRLVAGNCPAGEKPLEIKGSLPDPAWTCAREFEDFLRTHGIAVRAVDSARAEPLPSTPPPPADTVLLAEHASPMLLDLARFVNEKSDNLYAAQLLALAGGLRNLQIWMEAQNPALAREIQLVDGTGLSPQNRLTPAAFAGFLAGLSGRPGFEAWRGTLGRGASRLFKAGAASLEFQGKSWVKTGGMAGVAAAAGYLEARSGRLLAFAIVVNHFEEPPSAVRDRWAPLLGAWRERY